MCFYMLDFTIEKIPSSTMAASATSDIEVYINKWEDQKFITIADESGYEDYIGVCHYFDNRGQLVGFETYDKSVQLIGHEMNHDVYHSGLNWVNYYAYTNKKGTKTTIEFYDDRCYTMRKITMTNAFGNYKRWKQGDVEEFSDSEDEDED